MASRRLLTRIGSSTAVPPESSYSCKGHARDASWTHGRTAGTSSASCSRSESLAATGTVTPLALAPAFSVQMAARHRAAASMARAALQTRRVQRPHSMLSPSLRARSHRCYLPVSSLLHPEQCSRQNCISQTLRLLSSWPAALRRLCRPNAIWKQQTRTFWPCSKTAWLFPGRELPSLGGGSAAKLLFRSLRSKLACLVLVAPWENRESARPRARPHCRSLRPLGWRPGPASPKNKSPPKTSLSSNRLATVAGEVPLVIAARVCNSPGGNRDGLDGRAVRAETVTASMAEQPGRKP